MFGHSNISHDIFTWLRIESFINTQTHKVVSVVLTHAFSTQVTGCSEQRQHQRAEVAARTSSHVNKRVLQSARQPHPHLQQRQQQQQQLASERVHHRFQVCIAAVRKVVYQSNGIELLSWRKVPHVSGTKTVFSRPICRVEENYCMTERPNPPHTACPFFQSLNIFLFDSMLANISSSPCYRETVVNVRVLAHVGV